METSEMVEFNAGAGLFGLSDSFPQPEQENATTALPDPLPVILSDSDGGHVD